MSVTIVGLGEVGRVFERCARAAGETVSIVHRGEAPRAGEDTVIVSVREGDLAALLPVLAPIASRCAFVQNGLIEPLLDAAGAHTRGLIWFTVKGDFFRVLAPSIFFGPRARVLVELLSAGGVAAEEVTDADRFRIEAAIKLAWNNVVGLPLAVHRVKLGEYLRAPELKLEAEAVVRETCEILSRAWNIPELDPRRAFEKLLATTEALSWVTGGKKALEFRNGAIVRLAAELGLAASVNERLVHLSAK